VTKLIVRKIGNSYGVILPEELLNSMGVQEGDALTVTRSGNDFALSPRDPDFDRVMTIAEAGMGKYHVALRELAK